jgi:hypothetical protein
MLKAHVVRKTGSIPPKIPDLERLARLSGIRLDAKQLDFIREFDIYHKAVLFGSYARGDAGGWSDIDLIVIEPEFDQERSLSFVKRLWRARAAADIRIKPIPCGGREGEE